MSADLLRDTRPGPMVAETTGRKASSSVAECQGLTEREVCDGQLLARAVILPAVHGDVVGAVRRELLEVPRLMA